MHLSRIRNTALRRVALLSSSLIMLPIIGVIFVLGSVTGGFGPGGLKEASSEVLDGMRNCWRATPSEG